MFRNGTARLYADCVQSQRHQAFLQWKHPCTFPPAVCEGSSSSASWWTLVAVFDVPVLEAVGRYCTLSLGAVQRRDARVVQGCVSGAVALKLGGSSVSRREIKTQKTADSPV